MVRRSAPALLGLFVCLLALASAAAATYVHKRTYLHPTDVRNHATGTPGTTH